MRVFHAPSRRASGNERGARALERLCERVGAFRTRSLVGEDFEDVERELHAQFVETEREVLGELLESLDVDVARRGDRRAPIPPGARQHRELYHGGGVSEGQAHAVPLCP